MYLGTSAFPKPVQATTINRNTFLDDLVHSLYLHSSKWKFIPRACSKSPIRRAQIITYLFRSLGTTILCASRMEAKMPVCMRVLLTFALVATPLAIAGPKKKDPLPAYVLKAHTAVVIVDPSAGTSLNSPLANKKAQEDVEQALMKWGRLSLVLDPQSADLVIVIRKGSGKLVEPTIGGLPTNDRPVIVQQTDRNIRIGGQQGRAPGSPQQPSPQDTSASPQMEVAPPDDMFSVYEGRSEGAIDQRPIAWRLVAKNALHSPDVPAVVEFRKAVESAEKEKKSKP
jgi:hypothetical protein